MADNPAQPLGHFLQLEVVSNKIPIATIVAHHWWLLYPKTTILKQRKRRLLRSIDYQQILAKRKNNNATTIPTSAFPPRRGRASENEIDVFGRGLGRLRTRIPFRYGSFHSYLRRQDKTKAELQRCRSEPFKGEKERAWIS
ncbi:hypothetical protein CEXT_542751 [Caerostris extrusa]|uniref:Uncharacterized protein n=1 Tax=Caerostris extrusa TaxID=172846 RepID=A0AAV4RJT1_CAEEX|nr:hypothetical protein CEXT_542751 [Caerostris extrusa]